MPGDPVPVNDFTPSDKGILRQIPTEPFWKSSRKENAKH